MQASRRSVAQIVELALFRTSVPPASKYNIAITPLRFASTFREPVRRPHPLASISGNAKAQTETPRTRSAVTYISSGRALFVAVITGFASYAIAFYHLKDQNKSTISSPTFTQYKAPTKAGFEAALKELSSQLPPDCVSTDRDHLVSHGVGEWDYHNAKALPGAVLYPRSTQDVVAIVKAAAKHSIPLVPFAGGTSLEGHYHAPGADSPDVIPTANLKPGFSFCIDLCENMNSIVAVHEKDLDVVVQPGIGYEELNETLKERGIPLFFPVDPGPGAAIGGMVATGASGTNAVRYGTMRENVLNLTVVLPNGEVIKTRQRAKKSSAGPDMGRLFIGSEGTLGIVTEATLKLVPVLPYTVGVATFPTIEAAAEAVSKTIQTGVPVQCVEILDDIMMKAVNKANEGQKDFRKWAERPSLFFKFAGTEGQIKHDVTETGKIVKECGGDKLIFASNDKEKADLWHARKVALWSVLQYLPGCRSWTTDVCVPISNLPELVREIKADFEQRGIIGPIVGHSGDGNVHAFCLFRNAEELEKVKESVHVMVKKAQDLDGTATGEHGVGLGKIEYLERELGPGTVNLMKSIKTLIDPANIMNPGKLYPMEVSSQR